MKRRVRSTIHKVGTPEEENAVESGEEILKLIMEAKDFPEPRKTWIFRSKGSDSDFRIPRVKGKEYKRKKSYRQKEEVTYKRKRIRLVAHLPEK